MNGIMQRFRIAQIELEEMMLETAKQRAARDAQLIQAREEKIKRLRKEVQEVENGSTETEE